VSAVSIDGLFFAVIQEPEPVPVTIGRRR